MQIQILKKSILKYWLYILA